MTTIERLIEKTDTRFSRWQEGIIFEKKKHGKQGPRYQRFVEALDRQKELASAIGNGPRALGGYLRNALGLGAGDDIGAPAFPRKRLTPNEFRQPPVELEEELGRAWREVVSPRQASLPVFWLLCHVKWIEDGRFGDSEHLVRAALMEGRGKNLEDYTRNFLRRTGGLPIVRGQVSVFSDCPMAQAWWRWRLVLDVERVTGGAVSRQQAHAALHANHPAWEELAMLSIRRITVVNQPRARAALVSRLHRRYDKTGKLDKQYVKEVATHFARVGLRRSLEHTPWKELAG